MVFTASGGQAGIEAFSTRFKSGEPFDVVITDLGMPYLDVRTCSAQRQRVRQQHKSMGRNNWMARSVCFLRLHSYISRWNDVLVDCRQLIA
jgi:hypothetical protein